VREQFAGWKERSGQLERLQGGSEGGRKRGREETLDFEGDHESPGKKKRTVSDYFLLSLLLKFGLGPSEHPPGPVRLSSSRCNLQLLSLQELGV